jgi:hypothetical protein
MDIFYHIIFTSDNYYQIKKIDNNEIVTFMKILVRLPIELQMVIILRLFGFVDCIISSDLFNAGLKSYIETYMIE